MKPHTAGIVAALSSVAAVLISPVVLNVVPAKYAWIPALCGILLQAFTKPVTAGGTDLVPKIPHGADSST